MAVGRMGGFAGIVRRCVKSGGERTTRFFRKKKVQIRLADEREGGFCLYAQFWR